MNLAKKIMNKLDGLHYPQEYLCFAKESFPQPVHVYLVNGNRVFTAVTNRHAFTGYSPVIFALHSLENTGFDQPPRINIIFSHSSLQPNEVFTDKDAIARLTLEKIYQVDAGPGTISYYKATRGSHRFVPAFYQFMIGLNNRLYNKKPGNVFLAGNLYKQVQIAYAFPRIISVITTGKDNRFNLFPTDLHGPAGAGHYIISLRHEGKACRQVMESGQLVISSVNADAFKMVYALGKNHMQELKAKENFPFGKSCSAIFQLPLPEFALRYRELELMDSYKEGIHNLMLFKVCGSETAVAPDQQIPAGTTLAHIHNTYATWRYNNRLEGNYLLR